MPVLQNRDVTEKEEGDISKTENDDNIYFVVNKTMVNSLNSNSGQ